MAEAKQGPPPLNPCGDKDVKCKLIVAYVSLSSFFILHMIDINSRHVAVTCGIPIHNIGIYFDKIHTVRWLVWLIATEVEYAIFQIAGADRDPDDPNKGRRVRRWVNIICLFFVVIVRIAIFLSFFLSSNLAYHFYVLICIEAFVFGPYSDSYTALCAQYMTFISPIFNLCRLYVMGIQFILDRLWFDNPLRMLKIIYFIVAFMTVIAFGLLAYLNFNLKDAAYQPPKPGSTSGPKGGGPACESEMCKECEKKFGNDGPRAVLSPLMMNYALCVVKEFLYPATLPYALLKRDRCHAINMWLPFINNIGPLFYFCLDMFSDYFKCWNWKYDLMWLTFVPLPVIYAYSLMAIHTRNPSAMKIRNSRPRVMLMTFLVFFCYGCLNPLGMIGVAKYAFRRNHLGFTIMGLNLVIIMLMRSFFNRLSVGYTDVRVSLGYHLPKFRPKHRMSKSNVRWYIFRQTFIIAWKDMKSDVTLDIKKYL
ncbi:hypothetical protein MACK_004134 [Theileria orientalis]|uniref:Uncharacterized protein n=2 Tax=Theileria orientalis TaxID=68886 RepID=A0A976SJZ9_THEOR|nr:hypothetical protein MACK_004134 [Theileria orientalis]